MEGIIIFDLKVGWYTKQMHKSVLELIGKTPVVQVKTFDTGCCQLFLKLECQNPSGSIKDRIALSMIEQAERKGVIRPGTTLIEATAGNTGMALALVAALKGYRLILVIPDKMTQEKVRQVRALGAEVVITRSDVGKGHPEYYQDVAERIARETDNCWYVNQFANDANPKGHEETTGPEILDQLEGDVDAVVCGVGSGGTITGLGRFFRRESPKTELVLADPVGSILDHYVKTGEVLQEAGSWHVEGSGEDFIPEVADLSYVTSSYSISDKESFQTARQLLLQEGLCGGSSTGLLLAAALKYCQEQTEPKRVLTFVCDTGSRYLSKIFDDTWMLDQGLLSATQHGDLRDLIGMKTPVTVTPSEGLLTAYSRMRAHGISQLPVFSEGELVGIIDEWDLLHAVEESSGDFSRKVREVMISEVQTLNHTDSVEKVLDLLNRDLVPLVMKGGEYAGMITRIDYLNYLRKRADCIGSSPAS